MPRLRILTWNIHGCVGYDRRQDAERIAERIRYLAPDLAALQEVDTRRPLHHGLSEGGKNVADFLCKQIGDHTHRAWALSSADGDYGQILVSRFPLEAADIHDISIPGREPRKVITARITAFAPPLRVIATHCGLRRSERRRQLAVLKEVVAAEPAIATVLLGDLNEWRFFLSPQRSLFEHFESWTTEASFPARLPLFALDRILCGQGVQLERSWVDRNAKGASDHLPVLADIIIRG